MLIELKKSINNYRNQESLIESALGRSSDIKDVFLDDPDAVVIGAENDPEIKKLVSDIPEYVEAEIEEKVENIVENMLVETNFGGC